MASICGHQDVMLLALQRHEALMRKVDMERLNEKRNIAQDTEQAKLEVQERERKRL